MLSDSKVIKEVVFLVDNYLRERGIAADIAIFLVQKNGIGYAQAFASSMPEELTLAALMQQVERIESGGKPHEIMIMHAPEGGTN